MSKYNRKQKKPAQDEFIDFWSKLFRKVEPYMKAIGYTIGSAVVVWFAVYGISGWIEGNPSRSECPAWRGAALRDPDTTTSAACARTPAAVIVCVARPAR